MDDKIEIIEEALLSTQSDRDGKSFATVQTGLGTSFNIAKEELFLLRASYKGELSYKAPVRL